jgi:hypothetical protein
MSAFSQQFMNQHVQKGLASMQEKASAPKPESPMSVLHRFNKTKPGQCLGSKCGKIITTEDIDHAFCNSCWDKIFPPKPEKSSRRVAFADDVKKHDAQHSETVAFGRFFELVIMDNIAPKTALRDKKIQTYAAILPAKIAQWISEYDELWEQFPDGIVDPNTQVSAFSLKLVNDEKDNYWVPQPKTFKHPVIKTSCSSSSIALRGYAEHRELLIPIRQWLATLKRQPKPTPLVRKPTVGF